MHTVAYININIYIKVEIPFYANVQQKIYACPSNYRQ